MKYTMALTLEKKIEKNKKNVSQERKKNPYDTVANPALIQRRIAGPTWVAKAKPWQARRQSKLNPKP